MENNSTKIYEMYEILAAAAEWADNPENDDAIEVLENIKNSLIIRDYMPIKQKELCLKRTLIDIYSNENVSYEFSVGNEISLFFNCLLAYVVNINQEIDALFKEPEFYDLFHISGITDYILSFCEKDYRRLEKMVDKMISYENLKDLTDEMDMASSEGIDQLTEEFKKFRTETNPDILKYLGEIAVGGDPILTRAKKTIEDGAYNTVMRAQEIIEQKESEDSQE